MKFQNIFPYLFLILPLVYGVFAGIYYALYRQSLRTDAHHEGRKIHGVRLRPPAFFISENYSLRRIVAARDQLRIPPGSRDQPIGWLSYSETAPYALRAQMADLTSASLRGIPAQEMIETVFPCWWDVGYSFLGVSTATDRHRFLEDLFSKLWHRVASEKVIDAAQLAALKKELCGFLSFNFAGRLPQLADCVRGLGFRFSGTLDFAKRVPVILYEELLSVMATRCRLQFDGVRIELNYWDFLYMAVAARSDIVPVSPMARIVNVAQYIFIYTYLAVMTGSIVHFLRTGGHFQ